MDLATEHVTTHDLSHVRDNTKFMKGVVVFQAVKRPLDTSEHLDTTPIAAQEPLLLLPPPVVLGALLVMCVRLVPFAPSDPAEIAGRPVMLGRVILSSNATTAKASVISAIVAPTQSRWSAIIAVRPVTRSRNVQLNREPDRLRGVVDHAAKIARLLSTWARSAESLASCTKHVPQTESPSASTINASSGAVPPTSTQAEVTNDNPFWQTGTNGDRDREGPTTDNGADRAVEEVADQELPPVIQSLEIPTTQTLTVKLDTQVLDQHIISCSVRFESSFEVPIKVAPRGLAYRTATVRFTTDNIADQLSVQEVEIDSDIVETLLPSTIRDSISSLLTSDDRDSRLYHISFTTDPSLYNDNSKVFLGRHFYADSDMGPYTSAIRAARDMLYSSEQVVVHFFTIDSEWIQDHISTVLSSLEAQYNEYMLSKWWKGGDVNV
ncbi:hypothetical protein LTS18_010475 [Coniosporium uncinatum]|uniref:Uncharacterized protein n=1 Tax=Coniosporium uncinatum TaxID=93489 RepID=A0ACC3D9X9_9PEZI|nr:hypothetical protein LTS18_010475 [Coniosporium uncinatum]